MIMLIIIISALFCAFFDSGIGMMYGTILTPILLMLGFPVNIVIPTILLSQAVCGIIATIGHHSFKNCNIIKIDNIKSSILISFFGIIAVIAGAFCGHIIPKEILQTYIGILVLVMGGVVLLKRKFDFSWKKVTAISLVSAFNKSLSGGGYGPLMTTGLISSGISLPNQSLNLPTPEFKKFILSSFLSDTSINLILPSLSLILTYMSVE